MDIKSLKDIEEMIKNDKVKKNIFGYIKEVDYYDNIKKINEAYKNLYLLQEKKYKFLISHLKDYKDELL